MKAGLIHFIVALFMIGCAIHTLVEFNDIHDICDTVMSCTIGILNTILGAMWVIIEKIDSHENKTTKETEERSE